MHKEIQDLNGGIKYIDNAFKYSNANSYLIELILLKYKDVNSYPPYLSQVSEIIKRKIRPPKQNTDNFKMHT